MLPDAVQEPTGSGDRAQRGMPAFQDTLTVETTDAILAYVIKRANDEKAEQEAALKKN